MPRSKFIKGDNVITLLIKTMYFPLPISKYGANIEIALISPLMIVLLLMATVFLGMIGYTMFQRWVWLPVYCVFPMILLFISGLLIGRGVKSTLRRKLGLDPNVLFLRGTAYELETQVKGRWRFVSYILVSILISSFFAWWIYVRPLDYFQLGVKGDVEMTISLIRTWSVFIIPTFFSKWVRLFVISFTVLLLADFMPFTRQVLKRTNWLNMLALNLMVLYTYMVSAWWISIYEPVY
jgi:hypothetical protein